MNISEEAKQALADAQLIRARNRLRRDGCSSDAALRRRMLLLAAERNLPPAEYAKLMHKQRTMKPLLAFCEKHHVSLDWLMDGSLQGLKRMKDVPKPAPKKVFSSDELLAKIALLDPGGRQYIIDYIDMLIAQRAPKN